MESVSRPILLKSSFLNESSVIIKFPINNETTASYNVKSCLLLRQTTKYLAIQSDFIQQPQQKHPWDHKAVGFLYCFILKKKEKKSNT